MIVVTPSWSNFLKECILDMFIFLQRIAKSSRIFIPIRFLLVKFAYRPEYEDEDGFIFNEQDILALR